MHGEHMEAQTPIGRQGDQVTRGMRSYQVPSKMQGEAVYVCEGRMKRAQGCMGVHGGAWGKMSGNVPLSCICISTHHQAGRPYSKQRGYFSPADTASPPPWPAPVSAENERHTVSLQHGKHAWQEARRMAARTSCHVTGGKCIGGWIPVVPVTTMAKSAVLPRSSCVSSRNLETLKAHPSSMKPTLPSNSMLNISKPKCRRQQSPSRLQRVSRAAPSPFLIQTKGILR